MALTLACVIAPVATSVLAQAPGPDAGTPAPVAPTPVAPTPVAPTPVAPAPVIGDAGVAAQPAPDTSTAPPATTSDAATPSTPAPVDGAPVTEATPTTPGETPSAPQVDLPIAPTTQLEAGADPQTGIRGRIVDSKTGLGIEMAPVLIIGNDRTRTAISITHGAYELNVPPGVYTVRSFYDLYHGARLPNVRVTRGRFAEANLLLDPINEVDEIAVEEIEVPYRADTTTAAAQLEMRRASSGIGEGMGSQQMSQSGASDASGAARRVVGVTVEGTNLVIRGLGGRYARVYMNGVPLPSTDPDSPSVDLDLFPTNIIDSMTVSKAFLPDMPADFAGGVLDIATVTFPRDFTFKLSLSGEYASASTFGTRLNYAGSSTDFLGYDDGLRDLPDAVPPTEFSPRRYGDEEIAIARSFPNIWQHTRQSAYPNVTASATLGDAIDLGSSTRLGYLLTTQYSHKDRRTTGLQRRMVPDGDGDGRPEIFADFDTEMGSEDVQLATIGTVSLDLGADHSFTLLSMYNHSISDVVNYRRGVDSESGLGQESERWQLQYTGRTLWFNQALGDHRNLIGTRMRLRWNGYIALSGREDPDRRIVSRNTDNVFPELFQLRPNGASRIYQDLKGLDGGGNVSLRFPLWSEGWGTVGGAARVTNRDFLIRRFVMAYPRSGSGSAEDYAQPIEDLFENRIGEYVLLQEATSIDDSFTVDQSVLSAYAMVETPIVGPLSFAGGVRVESYHQTLVTKSPLQPDEGDDPIEVTPSERDDLNVLPAASLKYEITPTMLVRAAYGMTLGRPQARELATFVYFDFLRDRNIIGKEDLVTTRIHNLDLRWEWFFDEGQIIAASVFYKNFRDPIEIYMGPRGESIIYDNTRSARNIGAEVELRSTLKPIHEALRNFDLGANVTFVDSKVEIDEDQCENTACGPRQMFGQAPYVINVSLRFADPATKSSLGVVYNVVGPRLFETGIRNGGITPNQIDLPVHSLDLVGAWPFTDHLTLKLKWRNMLFQTRRISQGDVLVQRIDPGTFVQVGLDYAY